MQGSTNLLNLPKLDPTNDQVAMGATASQTGGWETYSVVSAATINAASIKASAGRIGSISIVNGDSATPFFVKFFNQATAPDPSADFANVILRYPLLALDNISINFGAGALFSAGLGIVITGGVADNDETAASANDVFVNLTYK